MSARAMLSLNMTLNIQPGEIPPSIHTKTGTDSLEVVLRIKAAEATLETAGTAIVKGTKPGGNAVFIALPILETDSEYIYVELAATEFVKLTDRAGKYKCTVSIIDTEDEITLENYEEYDVVTVQPFYMDVQGTAV